MVQGLEVAKERHDLRVWCLKLDGNLSLKRAFLHVSGVAHKVHSGRIIWNRGIAPSTSMYIIHGKLATDEELILSTEHAIASN